jgi:hypothetical protein
MFNFIFSNGAKTVQNDGRPYYTHMLPEGADKKIRSVNVLYHINHIVGFQFFDKSKLIIKEFGIPGYPMRTVVLAENEVIIGVIVKLV